VFFATLGVSPIVALLGKLVAPLMRWYRRFILIHHRHTQPHQVAGGNLLNVILWRPWALSFVCALLLLIGQQGYCRIIALLRLLWAYRVKDIYLFWDVFWFSFDHGWSLHYGALLL